MSRRQPAPSAATPFPFRVVSLFAGCGGSSLGYHLAGADVRLAVEWDEYAAAAYALNFPGTPIFRGDIADLSAEQALETAGLRPGELEVLDGSPPCQGFSTAGKRRLEDGRNRLFEEYVRLLRAFEPKALVMENVYGLVKGHMKLVFAEIMRQLKASGYRVRCRLMDSRWYGVPQMRQRLIFIGIREDLGIEPSHPLPAQRPVTVGEALKGCPVGPVPSLSPKSARLWQIVRPGKAIGHALDSLTPARPHNSDYQTLVKLDPTRPALTLLSLNTGRGWGTMVHWAEPRAISIPEAKRLMSFPDDFRIPPVKFERQWALLGNAVPPLLMKAVAEHVRGLLQSPARAVSAG